LSAKAGGACCSCSARGHGCTAKASGIAAAICRCSAEVRVDEDIRPLSEFRAGVATFVKQLRENRRPIVLTQRGRGVAVLVGVHEYEKMQERLEILEEVYKAEEQIATEGGMAHEDAKARVLSGLAQ